MNLYETDVLFHSVACSEHCLCKRSPPFLSLFSCYLSLSPSIFVRPQDAIVCAAFAVASQKLKSKTVYGEAVYGFGYFMQISSITFQSIRQTVAEGSLDRIRGWWEGVTSFIRSTGSSSIFVPSTFNLFSQSPDPPSTSHHPLSYLPFCRLSQSATPIEGGGQLDSSSSQFGLWLPPPQ